MNSIDLTKILRDKNPRLARIVPLWVVRRLERLICADRINYILEHFSGLDPVDFIGRTLDYIGVTYTIHGTQNITPSERYIFASNHPLGGLDGLILTHALSPYVNNDIKLIVNDILLNITPLSPLFVPVNKHGSQNAYYALQQKRLYASDSAVVTFPAGLCSRLIHGHITDPEWRRNFITKATQSQRQVIPVHISGVNSKSFYRTALLRKRLGIRANFEMLLLPREMFAQKGKHIDIYLGPAITPDNSITAREWCAEIRRRSYSLADNTASDASKNSSQNTPKE